MTSAIECSDPHGAPSCPSSGSDSPSYQALATARDYYKDKKNSSSYGNRYVLLVTSSEPSCASESHDVCSIAIGAAGDLGTLGVPIVVLSVGYQPAPGSCLSKLSSTPSAIHLPYNTSSLYTPSDTGDLASALAELFSAVARTSCTMTSSSIPPNTQLTVHIDGESIPEVDGSNPNGWSYSNFNNTSITLYGSACDDWVKSQALAPEIGYSCSPCGGPNACSTLWQQP